MSQKYFVCKFFCWLEMWTLWRCVSNWRGLHHPNMPKDWLCGWLHGRRSSPLGDGSQGCSPGGSQLCPGTQDRFSLFYEAPRIDVGRAGRASAHLQSGLRLSSPGPSPARGHAWCSVLPGDSSHCSQARAHQGQAQGSGQWGSGDKAREIKVSLTWTQDDDLSGRAWDGEISLHCVQAQNWHCRLKMMLGRSKMCAANI